MGIGPAFEHRICSLVARAKDVETQTLIRRRVRDVLQIVERWLDYCGVKADNATEFEFVDEYPFRFLSSRVCYRLFRIDGTFVSNLVVDMSSYPIGYWSEPIGGFKPSVLGRFTPESLSSPERTSIEH